MRFFLIALSLIVSFGAFGQKSGKRSTVTKKTPAKTAVKSSGKLPLSIALEDLGQKLIIHCGDGGNDFIRAFVYQAYLKAGIKYRYEVDEQLNQLSTNIKSRDVLLIAINVRCGGNEKRVMEHLYTGFGLDLTKSRLLTTFIIKTYNQLEPESEQDTTKSSG